MEWMRSSDIFAEGPCFIDMGVINRFKSFKSLEVKEQRHTSELAPTGAQRRMDSK